MNRNQLSQGVFLSTLPADRFKTCCVTLNFVIPSNKSTATVSALLPMVLSNSCKAWPDLTSFSKKLDGLYGASLSADSYVLGANRIIAVTISGIKDKYALKNEMLSAEYVKVLLETAFSPNFKNKLFIKDIVEIEKQKLKEILENEINEKRMYCLRNAKRKFYGETPAGVDKNGNLQDLEKTTNKTLTAFYFDMIRSSSLEIFVVGADEQAVKKDVLECISKLDRKPVELLKPDVMPVVKTQYFEENMDIVQGKLCMIFTGDHMLNDEEYAKMRVSVAILGSLPTSRLFMNVREKQSLCYYCSASYSVTNSMLILDSGVEHQNTQKAEIAILKELETLKTTLVNNDELSNAKLALCSALDGVGDSLHGLVGWYLGGVFRGVNVTPKDVSNLIQTVTAEDIKESMNSFNLSVVYRLTKEGE